MNERCHARHTLLLTDCAAESFMPHPAAPTQLVGGNRWRHHAGNRARCGCGSVHTGSVPMPPLCVPTLAFGTQELARVKWYCTPRKAASIKVRRRRDLKASGFGGSSVGIRASRSRRPNVCRKHPTNKRLVLPPRQAAPFWPIPCCSDGDHQSLDSIIHGEPF